MAAFVSEKWTQAHMYKYNWAFRQWCGHMRYAGIEKRKEHKYY